MGMAGRRLLGYREIETVPILEIIQCQGDLAPLQIETFSLGWQDIELPC